MLVHLSAFNDHNDFQELHELALSAEVDPVASVTSNRRIPDPRTFVGRGKLEEITRLIEIHSANLILVNHALSPAQERNLERETGVRVVDRNGLILDIFAQRAQSFEGKLQVELAQLQHLSTRLVRGWTHLERQKGGIGLRGPGETQLETDRRLIGIRIRQIRRRLEKVDRQRIRSRRSRTRADIPTVGLVGYTNAGKSTLFNALTGASTYAENKLFATLDPSLRRLQVSEATPVILADTVGFIRHLPHELVAAFRSTLQEVGEAELLLHVVDASSEERDENIEQVNQVLKEIGADDIPQILVYNKVDLIDQPPVGADSTEISGSAKVWISARQQLGFPSLIEKLRGVLEADFVRCRLHLRSDQGKQRSQLFSVARVLEDVPATDGGWEMIVELSRNKMNLIDTLEVIDTAGPGVVPKITGQSGECDNLTLSCSREAD